MNDTYEDIRQAAAQPQFDLVPVPVPEWNATVYLKPLSVEEGNAFSSAVMASADNDPAIRLVLIIASACDKEGRKLFTESDREMLSKNRDSVIQRLWLEALSLNGYTRDFLESYAKKLQQSQE